MVSVPWVLLLCDIEGAEKELLDAAAAPTLCGMDIIVECHSGAAKLQFLATWEWRGEATPWLVMTARGR